MKKNFLKRVGFYIQRHSFNIYLRTVEYNLLKFFLPRTKIHSGIKSLDIAKEENEIFDQLSRDGISDLGITVTTEQINSIIDQLQILNCYDTGSTGKSAVNLHNVERDVQLAHYMRDDLAQIPQVIQIANDSKILNVVSKYFGAQPTISNINCWWSFGERVSAKAAQFYHRDLDDFRFLKMFIYLTDVNDDNGPHVFVKGSHRSNRLKQLRRFSDVEVRDQFDNNNISILIKPKGTTFIEDTYGIHKGQLPQKGNRLILQVQYSYFPLHVENYKPQERKSFDGVKLDQYVNRLLFTN